MTTSIHAANAPSRDPAPAAINTVCRRINSRWTPTERRCRAVLAVAKQYLLFDQLTGRVARLG